MEVVIETRQNVVLSCKLLNVTEFNKKILQRNDPVRMHASQLISHEIFDAILAWKNVNLK